MATYLRIPVLLLIVLSLLFLTTCEELEREMLVVTGEVSNVSVSSADAGGQIIDLGQGATQHGHCYSREPNVSLSDPHTRLGIPSGAGGFTSPLSDLEPGSLYYVKAYISNGDITVYGSETSFTTGDISPAVLTTSEVGSVKETTAVSGGNITSEGSSEVAARGVVWSTSENPTLEDNEGFTDDGTGTGEFTSNLTGLKAGTIYYVRAYATNDAGSAYGNQQSFETEVPDYYQPGSGVSDIDGNNYPTVIIGNQEWMAQNIRATSYRDGSSIITGLSNSEWQNTTDGTYSVYPDGDIEGLNSDAEVLNAYGALYNWYAVDDSRGLCPTGWRVPSHDDWTKLEQYICNELGNTSCETKFPYDNTTWGWTGTSEGKVLKSCRQVNAHGGGNCATSEHPRWSSHDTQYSTDEFGFSAIPGGYRNSNGSFSIIGSRGYWWSSDEHSSSTAWFRIMSSASGLVSRNYDDRANGFSVRCVREVD